VHLLARVDRPGDLEDAGRAVEDAVEVETVDQLLGPGIVEHLAIQPAESAQICADSASAFRLREWLGFWCKRVRVKLHITLRDELVAEVDRCVGARRRSAFIAHAVEAALDDERRWELIESSLGAISAKGHEWDDDPSAWVREQRRSGESRVG
jgi:Arc/MetJ family transcription regulator